MGECTLNMSGGLTPGPMRTEGNCMKEAGRSCTVNSWRRNGRRSLLSGTSISRPSSPSGSASAPARSPEIPSPPTTRTRDLLRLLRGLRKKEEEEEEEDEEE